MSALRWLLDGDPAIRWQAMRDLTHEPEGVVTAERSRVANEGWGRALLELQAPDGTWGGPSDKGWMTTIQALNLLADLGVDPGDERARRAISRVKERLTWERLGGRPFFDGETEPCINGAILAAGSYFGEACEAIVDRLLDEQLEDGGWNCDAPPSTRSSFHTTIRVLEGLLAYEQSSSVRAVAEARARGHEYLLERRMLRGLRSGEIIDRTWTRFTFPTRWHYDVLRGLDYFRSAGVQPDGRVAEAVEIVTKRRHQNGRWPMNHLHADCIAFDMEREVGRASRWNTLRALRVLEWSGVERPHR